MPFADCTFDMVVSTGCIHHWKDATIGLNEIYRILKHGGYALMYDLVSDTPKSIMKTASQEFGKLKIFLLWLHAFDEPFYSHKKLHLLACPSLFKEGQTQFVGVKGTPGFIPKIRRRQSPYKQFGATKRNGS